MSDLIAVGSVYKLVSPLGLVYIGSTKKSLEHRLSEHKSTYKSYLNGKSHYVSSMMLFKESSDITIELVKELKECSKIDLLVAEKYCIELNECVNKFTPILIEGETKEYHKQYRQLNKAVISEKAKIYHTKHSEEAKAYKKIYNELNKDIIKEKKTKYLLENMDLIKEQRKQSQLRRKDAINAYVLKNKEAISEKAKEKIYCEACKKETRKADRTKHVKTQTHINNLKTLNQTNIATTIIINNFFAAETKAD